MGPSTSRANITGNLSVECESTRGKTAAAVHAPASEESIADTTGESRIRKADASRTSSADESKIITADEDEDVSVVTVNEKLESMTFSAEDDESVVDLAEDDVSLADLEGNNGSGEDDGALADQAEDDEPLDDHSADYESSADLAEEKCVADDECAMVSGKKEEYTTNSCAEDNLDPMADSIRDSASTLVALQDDKCPIPPKHDVLPDQSVDCEPTSKRLKDNSEDMPENDGPTIANYRTYVGDDVSTGSPGRAVSAANYFEADEFSNPESRLCQPRSPLLPINVIIEEVNPPDSIRSFFELLENMYRGLLPEVQTIAEENLFSVMKRANQLNEEMQSGSVQRNAWSMQTCS